MMVRNTVLPAALLSLMLALPACGQTDTGLTDAAQTADDEGAAVLEQSPAPEAAARKVLEENDTYEFSYSYPAEAAAIPALADLLDEKLEASRSEVAMQGGENREDAQANGYPFRPHYFDMGWSVSADTDRFLALQAGFETYTGGAHGNRGFDSLVWDRKAGRALEPVALFASPSALEAAVRERYCDALDAERAERRGEPVERVREDDFWNCPALGELTIALEAGPGGKFSKLIFLAAPYVAGSYAEGSYVIELPIDDAVRAAVKPVYREGF